MSIIALVTAIIQYQYGIRYSWDSNWYIILANRFGEGHFLERLEVYAPLYSSTLGFFQLMGASTVFSILLYWCFAYFLILIAYYNLTKNLCYTFLGFFAVLSNLTTASLFRFNWTELGYSAILLFAVIYLYKFNITKAKKHKIIFLLSLSILPLQRYIGGFVCVYLGLIYILANKNFINSIRDLIYSALPTFIMILWNIYLSGHISGNRKIATLTLGDNIYQTKRILFFNFSPEWFLYIAICISLFVFVIKKRQSIILLLIFGTPLVQICAQLYSSSTYFLHNINPRFFILLTPSIIAYYLIFIWELKIIYHHKLRAFILLVIALSLSNIFLLNNRHSTIIDKSPLSYEKIKHFVSKIPTSSTIGFYAKNSVNSQAHYIMANKIIPENYCKNYNVVGNINTQNISFVPDCDNLKGHKYKAIDDKSILIFDYILVDKNSLKKDWKHQFIGYKSIDLESFYGLYKLP